MILKSVTRVVQDVVLEGGIPAKVIAEKIGKPYSTLLRELNPFDEHAKLGVETLLQIMRVTRNAKPLEFMAAELGFRLVSQEGAERRSAYLRRETPEA